MHTHSWGDKHPWHRVQLCVWGHGRMGEDEPVPGDRSAGRARARPTAAEMAVAKVVTYGMATMAVVVLQKAAAAVARVHAAPQGVVSRVATRSVRQAP